jgi:hypothetical protein
MNAFNRFIITALLVLFTSQAFATNTLLATTTTENATAITETKAFANPFKYGNQFKVERGRLLLIYIWFSIEVIYAFE